MSEVGEWIKSYHAMLRRMEEQSKVDLMVDKFNWLFNNAKLDTPVHVLFLLSIFEHLHQVSKTMVTGGCQNTAVYYKYTDWLLQTATERAKFRVELERAVCSGKLIDLHEWAKTIRLSEVVNF